MQSLSLKSLVKTPNLFERSENPPDHLKKDLFIFLPNYSRTYLSLPLFM